jgi:hypothetical protein
MIISMQTTARPQQRYDHRLRNLVQRTGDVTVATDLGRLPDGRAKMRILRAVDRAHEYLPLRTVLRFLRVSPSRFHAWGRRQSACARWTISLSVPAHHRID